MSIARNKTAIKRRKLSRPIQLLIDDGILTQQSSLFDYGCGHGEDIKYLKKISIAASGWDPFYQPDKQKTTAPIVNLGYVLNTIEDTKEREETLRAAYALATDLLVVSVMIHNLQEVADNGSAPYGDGLLTSWNTFQKYFTQKEFKEYLQNQLQTEVRMAGIGVAYIFKTDKYLDTYFDNRIQGHARLISQELRERELKENLAHWIESYHELGRPPRKDELEGYNNIIRFFGSRQKAIEATRAEIDQETVKENAQKKKNNILIRTARLIIKNNGTAKLQELSEEAQKDTRFFFANFAEAKEQAMQMLKTLANLETVSTYINQSPVGKILPDDLYIHKKSLTYAPEMLQLLVEMALLIIPDDIPYNIIKIARNSHHVTFLQYNDFFGLPHPSLVGSMKVVLHKNQLKYRDFSKSDNPPILHRKELFIHPEHPEFELFSQLTQAEEEAGLLQEKNIGFFRHWQELLRQKGYCIKDHLLKAANECA